MKKEEIKSLLILLVVFALILRFSYIDRDFWHDEAFQLLYSEKPVSFILDSNDVHPPLFALFSKVLLSVSHSIIFLRSVMILLSLLFLWAFYGTIKEIFDSKVAFYALIFISVIPTYTYYSSEFRPYIFVLLFATLQIRYFNRLLFKSSWQNSLIFVGLSLIMLYSHYLSGLILLSEALYSFLVRKPIVREMCLTGLLCLPLAAYLINTLPKIQTFWFKNIDFHSLLSTFSYLLVIPTDKIVGLSIFVYGLIIFGLIKYRKDLDSKIIQFIIYLILPILTMFVISQFFPFYHHRYFLFCGIGIFVLLGWVTNKIALHKKDYELGIIAIFAILIIFSQRPVINSLNTELLDSAVFFYNYTDNNTENYILIHESQFSQSPFKVYFPGKVHLLKTNMTRDQRFTAGGAVIEDYEIISTENDLMQDITDFQVYFENHSVYLVSNRIGNGELVYDEGGVFITKLK